MQVTVLYPDVDYPDDSVERAIYGEGVQAVMPHAASLDAVDPAICAVTEGMAVTRTRVTASDFDRFPRLRVLVRMGVGYDSLDRAEAARRGVMVCNVPDYGTTEVADHAVTLALSLRRGVILHHDAQRRADPAKWAAIPGPLVRRASAQTFGVLGLGRIGTAAALRARAFGFRVAFFDPYKPSGTELALGLHRAASLEALLAEADVLSVHAPLTRQTRGMLGVEQLRKLPRNAVLVNTARGPIVDVDAVATLLREGHLAAAALDVLPVEPPAEPLPELIRAYRAREPWLEGRLVITPHAAFYSPEAYADIRSKSAETMRAALLTDRPQNVITPEME